jgi:alkylated DNA repair dioxygenase AlkB
VKTPPQGLVYEPGFIAAEEEAALIVEIARLPLREAQYKGFTAKRRIASFGSRYDFSANQLLSAAPIPEFLLPSRQKLAAWLGLVPGHFVDALVAEYRPGTSLGWHRDVPDFELVAGISLGAACRMRFRPYPPEKGARQQTLSIELEPRSAYVLRDAVRWRWQHSIAATPGLRYSITFRTRRR